jgi:hypothetical protein
MDELIEQVKRAMYEASPRLIFDEDGSTIGHVPWEEFTPAPFTWEGNDDLAIAAIRAVRAFDLAVGPTEAEIEAAMKASTGYWGNGATSCADVLTRASKAAAAERARVAEEVG